MNPLIDPDAVIERYLAQRPAAPEASADGVAGFASQAPGLAEPAEGESEAPAGEPGEPSQS